MRLDTLLDGLTVTELRADPACEITGVSYDSHTVADGHLFVAVSGVSRDGRDYIPDAVARGAACVVCETAADGVPCAVVPDARRALAEISANWYGHPARALTVVGVTGTNGKTTTTHMIRHILQRVTGEKAGLIGTIRNVTGGEALPAARTTPESRDLQALLRQMADSGCRYAVMEVSSHALTLERVWGVDFAAGVFTNLTQDHLDFHHTMEAYCDAKAALFRQCAAAVCNVDDPWHERLLAGSDCRRLSYGVENPAELRGANIRLSADGVRFDAATETQQIPVRVLVPGRFTVYNALGALGACLTLGLPLADCAAALGTFPPVRGRMEPLPTHGRGFAVLIDYAHTPDALENVLRAVRGFAEGRVIALFGCGGDRDRTKRPQMGAVAAALADLTVVTSDNPRSEAPEAIIADITAGMGGGSFTVAVERRQAIPFALSLARKDDVVVLCGKGHETYQEINGNRVPLDERELVEDWFTHH